MGAPTDTILDRHLEDRAFLSFEFSIPGSDFPVKFKLPFFENPKITETGTVTYQTYNPIGRNSSMFSYINTPSRKLNVDFTITPDHILEYGKAVTPDRYILTNLVDNREQAKCLFKDYMYHQGHQNGAGPAELLMKDMKRHIKKFYRLSSKQTRKEHKAIEDMQKKMNTTNATVLPDEFADGQDSEFFLGGGHGDEFFKGSAAARHREVDMAYERTYPPHSKETRQGLATIAWWINLVRASVKSHEEDKNYGPPIVRLHFGSMYNAVPCVCENYNIKMLDERGFDLQTLFPRGIDISMKLSELRVGEFKEFEPNQAISRDGVAGWEAIFKQATFDPGEII